MSDKKYKQSKADIAKQFDLPERQSKITTLLNQAGQAYCICRSSDSSRFMIACDSCEEWYHGDCINISEREAKYIKNYFCDRCREEDPTLKTRFRPQKRENDGEVGRDDRKKKRKEKDHSENKSSKRPSTKDGCGDCPGCLQMNDCGQFYQKFNIPGVLGCIDGTHIAIVRPAEYEERFFNRKRYHSLNVQIVCDSELNIISVDASHGGANHDSFIWNHHPLKSHLEQLHQAENETVWFLGDSGYPLRSTLMTPIVDTAPNTPQRYYTELHCRVRNTVERCIGVLKSRWRCLLVDRKLHYHPTMAGLITNACVVLHNIANAARLPIPELTSQEEQNEATMQLTHTQSNASTRNDHLVAGETIRNALIERLWSAR